jgi:hypothetical protein
MSILCCTQYIWMLNPSLPFPHQCEWQWVTYCKPLNHLLNVTKVNVSLPIFLWRFCFYVLTSSSLKTFFLYWDNSTRFFLTRFKISKPFLIFFQRNFVLGPTRTFHNFEAKCGQNSFKISFKYPHNCEWQWVTYCKPLNHLLNLTKVNVSLPIFLWRFCFYVLTRKTQAWRHFSFNGAILQGFFTRLKTSKPFLIFFKKNLSFRSYKNFSQLWR